MEAVDGNAIGGLLLEVFGTEMTSAPTVCETCGDARPVAVRSALLVRDEAVERQLRRL